MRLVGSSTVDTRCPIEPILALNDRLVVDLKDGRKLDSGDIRFARGNAMLPLKEDELKAKFFDCCGSAGEVDAARLYERLGDLRGLPKLRSLAASAGA